MWCLYLVQLNYPPRLRTRNRRPADNSIRWGSHPWIRWVTVNEPSAGTMDAIFGTEPVMYGWPVPDEILEVQMVVSVPERFPIDFK